MAEIIIGAVITLICSLSLCVLGIVQYRSDSPVGFWSGKEPPKKEQVTDVRAYNRKHGIMWILYGAGLFLCMVLSLPFGGIAVAAAVIVEVFGGLALMIYCHNRIERQYLR